MSEIAPEWRQFPRGVSAASLVSRGEASLREGDIVAAGNWFVYAMRKGEGQARSRLGDLMPQLESLAMRNVDAKALLAGIMLDLSIDVDRSFELFGDAAESGVPEGKRGLGFMLLHGLGVQKDPVRANLCFESALQDGDLYSAYNLAVNFHNGAGVERNDSEYLRLLRMAAEGGIPEACALLGDELSDRDLDAEALSYYLQAAEEGHAPAMFVAACWCRDGVGTEVDKVRAIRWFLGMLDRGDADGIHPAHELAQGMAIGEVREAGRLAGREEEAELLIRGRV
ncbi:tetratricopeptide repeat protein [Streptomyces sp. NPDC023838]|uniref:tetratricopeptide repeat protein n=1 Tax=Streptomyces sp. NPDC023838 TaxID=3154325 RepID=UPI0033D771DE